MPVTEPAQFRVSELWGVEVSVRQGRPFLRVHVETVSPRGRHASRVIEFEEDAQGWAGVRLLRDARGSGLPVFAGDLGPGVKVLER